MDFDFGQDFETTGLLFKLMVLLAVGAAYVIFEALLTRFTTASKRPSGLIAALESEPLAARAEQTQLVIEAYRPISSWSSATKIAN